MPESIPTHRSVPADFLTGSYRVVGQVMVPGTGMVGILNDMTTSLIQVVDVKLARVHMATKLVGEYRAIDVVKPNLYAVCLTRREDVGPQALARGGFQQRMNYALRITTAVYELEGTLEWPGRFDLASILLEGENTFVPLYDATLKAILIPQLTIESPAILLNRRMVDLAVPIPEKREAGV
jgi:hypothetical protein